jgi:hypothetical protein
VYARQDRRACPAFTVPARGHNDPPVAAQPASAPARLDGHGLPGPPPAAPIVAWSFGLSVTGGSRRTVTGGGATPRHSRPVPGARSPCQPGRAGGPADDVPARKYLDRGNARSDTRPRPGRLRSRMPPASPAPPGCSRRWLTGLPPADTAVLIAAPPHTVGIGEFGERGDISIGTSGYRLRVQVRELGENARWPGRTTRSCQNRSPSCGTLAMRRAWASSTGTPAA